MTLPGSGTISINSLVGEFGGSAPHALSEYYRNGGLVSSGNTNIPTSGALSLSDFYGSTSTITRDIRVQMSYNAGHGYSAFGVTSANSTASPQSYSGSLLFNPFTIYSPVFRAGTGYLGQNLSFTFSQNEDAQGCSIYLYGGTSPTAVNTVVLGLNAGYSSGAGGSRSFTVAFNGNGGCTSITNTGNSYNYSLISISVNSPSTSHRWYMWRCISPNATQKASTMMNGDPTSLSSVTQPA
jgi:hypothetical protein